MDSLTPPSDSTLIPTRKNKSILWAWRISMVGALLLLVALPLIRPSPYWEILTFLPDGILRTFQVTFSAMVFSLILGFVAGLGQISRIPFLKILSTTYVEIIRGIPLLVQLFFFYYALGRFFTMPRLLTAVLAISICYGAYMSEIFRAGLASIPRGQMEASLALGMSRGQSLWWVILPQTFRIILPPLGNEFIALLKDSSLVSVLAISDLLRRGREFASVDFSYFETYSMVVLVYLVITLFLSKMVAILEEKLVPYAR